MDLYKGEPVREVFCMDSKSFYASVECVELGLNPITTLLVVMSGDRNDAGLILAASPMAKKSWESVMSVEDSKYRIIPI